MEESYEGKAWQLSEFASLLNRHFTTVNGWFKTLEEKGIHYVNRIDNSNHKVYTELDLELGKFIVSQTAGEGNWKTSALMNLLESSKENPPVPLRPFPSDYNKKSEERSIQPYSEIDRSIELFIESIEPVVRSELKIAVEPLIQQSENMLKTIESMRLQLSNQAHLQQQQLLINQKILSRLKLEALEAWEGLPEGEKYTKTGFFKRELNLFKREQYIENYVADRYDAETAKEMTSLSIEKGE